MYLMTYIINYKGFDMCVWNSLNVMHVHALINNLYHKSNKFTNFKIVFLCKINQNSDMFQSKLIVFKELHDIKRAYMKTWTGY